MKRDASAGSLRTAIATVLALIGFAANSVLCRKALGSHAIDAWSFTCIRLGGGALALFLIVRLRAAAAMRSANRDANPVRRADRDAPSMRRADLDAPSVRYADRDARSNTSSSGDRSAPAARGSWASAFALFAYAGAFSLAYLRLGAGVGALVLFACVQATMIGCGIVRGERPSRVEWSGIAIALAGLVLLTLPGAVAPDPIGFALMMIAGIAWGAYSVRGRSSRAPLVSTADNFARSVPMALGATVLMAAATAAMASAGAFAGGSFASSDMHVESSGVWLALASGCVASGLGYSLWYSALPGLTAARAAIVQLVVPILAAALGIAILGEHLTARLSCSALMILGGVALAIAGRRKPAVAATAARIGADPEARSLNAETPAR